MSQFDVDAFCNVTTGDVGRAICAVNVDLQGVKDGLNTFILVFAVSFRSSCATSISLLVHQTVRLRLLFSACVSDICTSVVVDAIVALTFSHPHISKHTGCTCIYDANWVRHVLRRVYTG